MESQLCFSDHQPTLRSTQSEAGQTPLLVTEVKPPHSQLASHILAKRFGLWQLVGYRLVHWLPSNHMAKSWNMTSQPIKCNGFFFDKENICISFELLDLSLQDYVQEKNPRGLTTRELRPILHQLATALSHLHSSGIIHADLKPPNVMVVNRHEQPLKVKLIDFGVARLVSAVNQGDWMGTLHYSAPEMLLGVPFNESVDMWALGLLMVELATGCQLYPGKTEYDVLRFIFETQGQPCDDVLDRGCYTPEFFFSQEFDPGYEEDQKIFVSLIKSMLSLDAGRRITAQEVLEHRFFAPSLHQNSTDFSARSPVPPLSAASWEERVDNNHQNPASWHFILDNYIAKKTQKWLEDEPGIKT
uniref:Protein kinase domain-containing protein n=1 Tax=Amphiprion percula TaxID=161767 RepID=A0A3P8SL39_AMPPE